MLKPLAAWAGVVVLCSAVLAACSTVNPHYNSAKKHHRPDGFNNNYIDNWAAGQPSFFRWQWERLGANLLPDEPALIPVVKPDLALLRSSTRDVRVTWLGHSTALWQINGLNILTDPHFTERASPVSFAGPARLVPQPAQLADLPRIDVVLISHNHYDHLDRQTVLALNAQVGGPPLFVVPLGIDLWLQNEGIQRTHKLDWWDSHTVPAPGGAVQVHLVPVQHWSSRSPWDRNATLWGGFVVQASVAGANYQMFYAGDTGYSKDFADIAQRFGGFDFAQIPVGCYEPRWFMSQQHINEEEAVRIHQDVKSKLSMGVHWGTFRLCDEPIQTPLKGLPAARQRLGVEDSAFVLLPTGQTRVLKAVAP
jgi:N-acyl-phosphatidylethanolamine-hydrolysing phospholipase D